MRTVWRGVVQGCSAPQVPETVSFRTPHDPAPPRRAEFVVQSGAEQVQGVPLRYDDVYIVGSGSRLPSRLSVKDALAEGLCGHAELAGTDMLSVSLAGEEHAPGMAAVALREALQLSGMGPESVGLLLYANVFYQGHDLWAAASHVQAEAGLSGACTSIEVRQMSNGGMAALQLAATALVAGTSPAVAVAAADRFDPPGLDRWRSDPGALYGDGAAALVLARKPGVARVRSIAMVSDPSLESMHRGDVPFGRAPFSQRSQIDLLACRKAFVAREGITTTVARISAGQQQVVQQALDEADTGLEEITRFLLPHFGRRRIESAYSGLVGSDLSATTWDFSRTVGHLGAGDQYASFDHVIRSGSVAAGERWLLLGVGAGFSWSGAVIEVL